VPAAEAISPGCIHLPTGTRTWIDVLFFVTVSTLVDRSTLVAYNTGTKQY